MTYGFQPPPPPRTTGPRLATALVTGGIGLAIAIVAVVAILIPLAGDFTSTSYAVPGVLTVKLDHARYTVYQRTGTRSGLSSSTLDPPAVRIIPSSVIVTAPDGSVVPVSEDLDIDTLTRGSAIYSGALVLEPPAGGKYQMNFVNQVPTTVVVARSLRDAIRQVRVWFVIGGFGGALLVAGVVMLIVGSTRRGRARRAMYPGWGTPQGQWYPGAGPQWGPPASGAPPYPPPPPPGGQPPGNQPPGSWPPPPA